MPRSSMISVRYRSMLTSPSSRRERCPYVWTRSPLRPRFAAAAAVRRSTARSMTGIRACCRERERTGRRRAVLAAGAPSGRVPGIRRARRCRGRRPNCTCGRIRPWLTAKASSSISVAVLSFESSFEDRHLAAAQRLRPVHPSVGALDQAGWRVTRRCDRQPEDWR